MFASESLQHSTPEWERHATQRRFITIVSRFLPLLLLTVALPLAAGEITPGSVLLGMNFERAALGIPPLQAEPRLAAAARDRMHDMEDLGYWSHESPDGRSPFCWFRPNGYPFSYAGENLANGFETEELLMESWMESRGHRQNIMSSDYVDCGIAVIDGATTGRAAGRSIVVLFARPLASAQSRPSR